MNESKQMQLTSGLDPQEVQLRNIGLKLRIRLDGLKRRIRELST